MKTLVIGFGNSVRRDDGVGPAAAEIVEARFPPGEVEVLTPPHLLPEIALAVSQTECVILIDAATEGEPGTVRVQRVEGEPWSPSTFAHQLSPGLLLGLVRELYGSAPVMYIVSVTGGDYDFGQGLSPPVRVALPRVVAEVDKVIATHR